MAQDVNIKIKVDTSQANNSTDNYKARLKQLKDEMTALQVETDGLTKASAEQRKRFSELSAEAEKYKTQCRTLPSKLRTCRTTTRV